MTLSDLLPAAEGDLSEVPGTLDDEAFAMRFPNIWLLCTAPVDAMGKKRKLATLVFFIEGGVWKIRLSERNASLDLWSGGKTFESALRCLEDCLCQRPVPWRKPTVSGRR